MADNNLKYFQEKMADSELLSTEKNKDLFLRSISFSVILFLSISFLFFADMLCNNRIGTLFTGDSFLISDSAKYLSDSYMFFVDIIIFPFCFYWSYLMKKLEKDMLLRDPSWGERMLLIANLFLILITIVIMIVIIFLFVLSKVFIVNF